MKDITEFYKLSIREKRISNILQIVPGIAWFLLLLSAVLSMSPSSLPILVIIFGTIVTFLTYKILLQKRITTRNISSSKEFFEKIGYEKIKLRYDFLIHARKETLKIFIVFVIFGVTLYYLSLDPSVFDDPETQGPFHEFLVHIIFIPGIIVYCNHVIIIRFTFKNDFFYYYSMICFKIISDYPKLPMEQKSLLIHAGLDAYNNYLRRIMDRHIVNTEIFYTKILSNSDDSMNETIQEINSSFHEENKLDVLRFLGKLYADPKQDFLARDISSKKLLDKLLIVLGPLVTILIYLFSNLNQLLSSEFF